MKVYLFLPLSVGALLANATVQKNATRVGRDSMDCGSAKICGALVLETGLGSGNYEHSSPVVHGIWPETGDYGTSECVAPSVSSDTPTSLFSCYDDLDFMQHEWTKHGVCAGVKDAEDFFDQVCALSKAPLAVMTSSRSSGGDLDAMASALDDAGYPIFYKDDSSDSQIYLSACATSKGKWVVSSVDSFGDNCA